MLDELDSFVETQADTALVVKEIYPYQHSCVSQNIGTYLSKILYKVKPLEVTLTLQESTNLLMLHQAILRKDIEYNFDAISKMLEFSSILNWYNTKFLPVFNNVSKNGKEPVFIKGSAMSMKDVIFKDTFQQAQKILEEQYAMAGRDFDPDELIAETEMRTLAHELSKITDPKVAFGYMVKSDRIAAMTEAYHPEDTQRAFYISPFDDSFDLHQEVRSFVSAENGGEETTMNGTSSYMGSSERFKTKLLSPTHPYAETVTKAASDYLKGQVEPDLLAEEPLLKEIMGNEPVLREDAMLRVRPTLKLLEKHLGHLEILRLMRSYIEENAVMDLCIQLNPLQFLDEKVSKEIQVRFIELNSFPRPNAFVFNCYESKSISEAVFNGHLTHQMIYTLKRWKEALVKMIATQNDQMQQSKEMVKDYEKTLASLLIILGEKLCDSTELQAHREIVSFAAKKTAESPTDGNFICFYNDADKLYRKLKPNEKPIARIAEHTLWCAYYHAKKKQGKSIDSSEFERLLALK